MPDDNVTRLDPTRPRRKRRDPPPPPPGGWPDWHSLLIRDSAGRIAPNVANVLIALRHDPLFENAFGFDEMRQDSIIRKPMPIPETATPNPDPPRALTDDDVTCVQTWLQHRGLPYVGRETVGQAIERIARESRFHPVRARLNSLVWDGVTRLDRWMFTCLGARATTNDEIEYVAAIGKMFLIAMVARVFEPGCQADYMLVLEGPQGALKSSACRVLAGEWFTDSLPENIASKDAHQHMRGKWLIEVKELASFKKAEVEDLKSFIDRRFEDYRPPYAKRNVLEPRQCVLVGTTNQEVYIKDDTGARRFWPVVVSAIDLARLASECDQLFAEAVVRYRRGERWWPTPADEDRYFKPEQAKRQEQDAWFPTISDWLERQMIDKFTVSEIAKGCLGFDGESRVGRIEQLRILSVLSTLGWAQERTMRGRYYLRPARNHDA